jgi:hypothetical protein
MIRENQKIDRRSVYFRFGEGVVQMNFSLPDTLRQAVKEEARDLEISVSAFLTDVLIKRLKKTNPVIEELNGREKV